MIQAEQIIDQVKYQERLQIFPEYRNLTFSTSKVFVIEAGNLGKKIKKDFCDIIGIFTRL